MSSVSIGKGMNPHQAMMKTHRQFIRRIGAVFQPKARVAQKNRNILTDSIAVNS